MFLASLAAMPTLASRSSLGVQSARHSPSALLRLRGGAEAGQGEEQWDYIIVGGGAAGSILANRLSADPSKRVLLLEAGRDASRDLKVRVPAMLIKVLRSDVDWNFETEPCKKLNDHSVYLCRGKTLGGSTCTNVQLYHRGSSADYASWVEAGAKGWGPDDVLPYFRKHERHFGGASKYHGGDGPMAVGHVPYVNPLSEVFFAAAGELGYRRNLDFNDWSAPQEGFGRYTVTQDKGERVSTATTYLKEAAARPNLCVRTGAHVTKLDLARSSNGPEARLGARGVTYLPDSADAAAGTEGEPTTARLAEGGEVLLAAGAVQSPQLLMLSGIGPRAHLEATGITEWSKSPPCRGHSWTPRARRTGSEGLGLPPALVRRGPASQTPPRGRGLPARGRASRRFRCV